MWPTLRYYPWYLPGVTEKKPRAVGMASIVSQFEIKSSVTGKRNGIYCAARLVIPLDHLKNSREEHMLRAFNNKLFRLRGRN